MSGPVIDLQARRWQHETCGTDAETLGKSYAVREWEEWLDRPLSASELELVYLLTARLSISRQAWEVPTPLFAAIRDFEARRSR